MLFGKALMARRGTLVPRTRVRAETRAAEQLSPGFGSGGRNSNQQRASRETALPAEPDSPTGIAQRGGDFLQQGRRTFEQHAKAGIEKVVTIRLDGGVFVQLAARTANTSDGVIVLQPTNGQFIAPKFVARE